MIPFQERKKIREFLYSRITLVALAILLIAVGGGSFAIHQKARVAISERAIAEKSFTEMKHRLLELQTSIERLNSDIGKEEEVRQKYSVARPGEEVVIVVDDSMKKGENIETVTEKGFWHSFVSSFTAE